MSKEQLILEIKTAVSASELTIWMENGECDCLWYFGGHIIGWAYGIPSNCQNKPRGEKSVCCVHFGVRNEVTFLSPEMQRYVRYDTMRLCCASDEVGKWINQQSIFARKVEFF
ncbi:MAG: hypothetical protein V4697_02450, partial [Patescibacteria group bacterium]